MADNDLILAEPITLHERITIHYRGMPFILVPGTVIYGQRANFALAQDTHNQTAPQR